MKFVFLMLVSEVWLGVKGIPKGPSENNVEVQGRLLQTLLKNYDKRIIPQINDSVPIGLSIGIKLMNLVELFEHEEILETSVYMQQIWTDFRLSWDPSRYQRIHVIHVPVEELWQPDVSLYNNADVHLETMNTLAMVFSNGHVYYAPKARIRTRCDMDMTQFPYDKQLCSIKFGSFTYDGNRMNLTMYPENNTFDLTDYTTNKEWHVVSTSATIITKRYECCPEPYQHIQFNLDLQRKSVYYTHVFILPAVVIAILVPFQFLLPPDCRERLTIEWTRGIAAIHRVHSVAQSSSLTVTDTRIKCSTLLLGITILIAMIQNFLPEAHPNLPYIVQYYCLTMVWIAISILLSICVINTQSREPRKRKVPGIVRKLFLKTLKKLVCLNEDNYYPLDDAESVSLRSIEKQSVHTDHAKNDENKLERDVEEILKQVNTLVIRSAIVESHMDARNEWYQVALVFDRIMCFLFALVFVVYSCALLS